MSVERNPWTEAFWSITAQAEFVEQQGAQKAREMIEEAGLNPDRCVQEESVAINKQGKAVIRRQKPYVIAPLDEQAQAPSLVDAFSKASGEKFETNLGKPHEPTETEKEQSHFTRAVCAAQNARNLAARSRANTPGWKSGRLPE